jgi:L-ascorbate metabolism protein UlaG (beta-lactamase superfamily)
MDVTLIGQSSFRIRGKTATVVTDPFHPDTVGMKFPKGIAADIVTVSHDHPDHNAVELVDGTPYVIRGPGEYDVKGVGVIGFASFHDEEHGAQRGKNTLYHIVVDGVNFLHLGDLGTLPSTKEIESYGNVDVLFVPVGGTFTIDAAKAATLVGDIEPKIVIPMHYRREGITTGVIPQLNPVADFLKAIGKEETTAQPKLSLTKDKIPADLTVVVLE